MQWAVQEPDFVNTLNWSTSIAIWLWSSAVADCFICGTLAWALRRRVAGFNERTDGLLKRLAWLSVRSASYTAVVAVGGGASDFLKLAHGPLADSFSSTLAAIAGSLYRDTIIEWSNLSVAFWAPMPPLYGFAFFSTTSSSRRAIENAFAPSSTHPVDGAVTFPSPTSLAQNEKRAHSPSAASPPRRLSITAPARLASVLERVRAACTGSSSSSSGRTSPYEVDLERARLGGGGAGRAGQRNSFGLRSVGSTISKAAVRSGDERAWRTSTHTQTQGEPRELRIQVDQLVETRVEWSDEVEPPLTPY